MKLSIVHSLPEKTWRDFVDQHPDGNIFHTPEMFRVFQNTKDYAPELWAAVGEDGQVLALFLPVKISLRSGLLKPLTTRAIVFGSILCRQTPEAGEALRSLLEAYQRETGRQSVFTEMRNVSSIEEYRPILEQVHFTYEDHLNYLISLDHSADTVFKNIGKRTQKSIRHGLNQGKVVIEEVKDPSGVSECYELLRTTYALAQVPLADRSLFENAYTLLAPKGMLLMTLARVGGEPAATSVELLYKRTMFGWYGGLDRSYAAYVPNEMLMWYLLRWGVEQGYQCYDFGGAGKPNETYGVRDFKAKFGGALVCYGRNTWIPNSLVYGICSAGYEVYRRVVKINAR